VRSGAGRVRIILVESGLRPLIDYRSHEYLLRRRRSFFSGQPSAISDQLLFAAEFLMVG